MRLIVGLLLACLVVSHANLALGNEGKQPPNVILIFIDDLGFGDVEFNGAQGPRTPNLNRMAAEGMKLTDFYVGCAVCSGSRTALLTGTHYQRLSMNPVLFPNSNQGLHPEEQTIADMLREAGYRTACVGKWHLGHLPPCLPTYQGFDSYYGIPYSNDMWIDPANKLAEDIVLREGVTMQQMRDGVTKKNVVPLMRNEEIIEYPCDQNTITKRYTEEAIRFIQAESDKPFFLYLPHTMVHLPLHVSKDFQGRTDKLIWDAIEEVDWSVGEILKTIRHQGIAENTLVLFTSDNGAAVGSSLPLRAKKASVYDGGIREPTLMWWPGTIPAGSVCDEITASIDLLPTLAKLCNGKLSGRKIDGVDIRSVMLTENAEGPRESFVLMHGEGTVRHGNWKYYPWKEKKQGRDAPQGRAPSNEPVQLYDIVADIGETNNVAAQHPDLCKQLQKMYEEHVADIKATKRPTAPLLRPQDAKPPTHPNRRNF